MIATATGVVALVYEGAALHCCAAGLKPGTGINFRFLGFKRFQVLVTQLCMHCR